MKEQIPHTGQLHASVLRALEDKAYRGRSDVYRCLRKNYACLVAQQVGAVDGPSWNVVAEALVKCGYLGARGQTLSGRSVRRVFRRVQRDIERAVPAAIKPEGKSMQPSRQRAEWKPNPPASTPPAVGRTGPTPVSRKDAEARIAELRRTFAERSGY